MQANHWKKQHGPRLRELKEVCGVGVAKNGRGENDFVVAVLLNTASTAAIEKQIGAILEDIPFKVIVTGPFKLLPARGARSRAGV
jgi:hypothetical protein